MNLDELLERPFCIGLCHRINTYLSCDDFYPVAIFEIPDGRAHFQAAKVCFSR